MLMLQYNIFRVDCHAGTGQWDDNSYLVNTQYPKWWTQKNTNGNTTAHHRTCTSFSKTLRIWLRNQITCPAMHRYSVQNNSKVPTAPSKEGCKTKWVNVRLVTSSCRLFTLLQAHKRANARNNAFTNIQQLVQNLYIHIHSWCTEHSAVWRLIPTTASTPSEKPDIFSMCWRQRHRFRNPTTTCLNRKAIPQCIKFLYSPDMLNLTTYLYSLKQTINADGSAVQKCSENIQNG